jgi:subtilase family serine protease
MRGIDMHVMGLCAALIAGALSLSSLESLRAATMIPSGATVAATPPGQTLVFSVYLPMQNKSALDALVADQQNIKSALYHKWLTPAQFNTQFGASPSSVANAKAALESEGFKVLGVTGRAIQVSGTAEAFASAFSTSLSTVSVNGRSNVLATTGLQLPAALKAQGVSVSAFATLPRMHMHSSPSLIPSYNPANRYTPAGGYWYDDLKQAYDYPSYQSLDGTGASVAIVISSDVLDSDIAAMFNHEKFTATTGKSPPVHAVVPIDGGAPPFGSPENGGYFEASLDVQQVLGGAPGAQVTVVDIPDLSDGSILDGYNYIVNAETASGAPFFQLVNSSFGECELFYGAAYNGGEDFTFLLDYYNALFEQGNAEGITFVASSGDSGGLECPDTNYVAGPVNGVAPTAPSRFLPGVEFPASSPFVTAVGGTNLVTTYNPPSLNSAYVSENGDGDPELPYDPYGLGVPVYGGFWGAGGGLSAYFSQPPYQALVNTGSTFRTTPDVGMQVGGCPAGTGIEPCGLPRSYVLTYIGGVLYGVIGTSVASPEFVSALALAVEAYGPLGNANYFLYQQGAAQTAGGSVSYNRNIPSFDGKYTNTTPSTNYNYIVGNGTPQVRKLFGMTAMPAAGAPQTPSNP